MSRERTCSISSSRAGAGSAPGNGGALHLTGAATADVVDSGFTGNTAAEGGALWNSAAGTLTVSGTLRANGGAGLTPGSCGDGGGGGGGSGGAIFLEAPTVTTTGATIEARGGNGARVVQAGCHRLFAQDRLAGGGGGLHGIAVQVVWRGDVDRLHLRVRQQPFHGGIGFRAEGRRQ